MKSLNDFIIALISKDFESNITELTKKQSLLVIDILEIVAEKFAADVCAKYLQFNFQDSESELIKLIQGDCTLLACLMYRIERELFLSEKDFNLLNQLANLMRTRTGIELYYSTDIGKGLNIQHGVGIVVGPRYKIGENFLIHQGVTLGQRRDASETIIIGDNVSIFAGAKIIGNLSIGDNVKIAANAVLLTDALENSTYAGMPAVKVN